MIETPEAPSELPAMPSLLAVEHRVQRVELGVAALGHPPVLLGGVVHGGVRRGVARLERRRRGGEEEVDRVLGARR